MRDGDKWFKIAVFCWALFIAYVLIMHLTIYGALYGRG